MISKVIMNKLRTEIDNTMIGLWGKGNPDSVKTCLIMLTNFIEGQDMEIMRLNQRLERMEDSD